MSAEHSKDQEEIKRACRGLIDSEYEALEGFEERDLYDYLSSIYLNITRETSNSLFATYF